MGNDRPEEDNSVTGVLALQGDFAKHIQMLEKLGRRASEVRTAEELANVSRLIIPGGESTAVGLLMKGLGLGEAIIDSATHGMPIWGTCMGMIMMSKAIVGRPQQFSLGLLDISIERNAFGAQVHSFEDRLELEGESASVMGVFIRAPVVVEFGPDVQILCRYRGKVVAVRQGRLLGTSFHPELTDDARMHRYFLEM